MTQILLSRASGGKTLYYLNNEHGDVTALTDGGDVVVSYYYDAFGNVMEESGSLDNSILYSGYQYDEETGLYGMGY